MSQIGVEACTLALNGMPAASVLRRAGGATLCFGNFDELHHGHRALVERTVAEARAGGRRSCAVVFRPRPSDAVRSITEPFLVPLDQTIKLLRHSGIDHVGVLRFNRELALMGAGAFLERLLMRTSLVQLVIAGDTTIGRGKEGARERVAIKCKDLGINLVVIRDLRTKGGLTRSLLAGGKLKQLAGELLRAHTIPAYILGEHREAGGITTFRVLTPKLIALPPDGYYAVDVKPATFHGEAPPLSAVSNLAVLSLRTMRDSTDIQIELVAPLSTGWGDTFACIELIERFTPDSNLLLDWVHGIRRR